MRLKLLQILTGTHPEEADATDYFKTASCIHAQYQKLTAASQYFVKTISMLSSANQEAVLAFFGLDINRQQMVCPVIDQSRNISPVLHREYLHIAERIVTTVMLPSHINNLTAPGSARISPSDNVPSVLMSMALDNLVIESNYSRFMLLQYSFDGVMSAITSVCRDYVNFVAYLVTTLEKDQIVQIIDLLHLSPAVMASIVPIVSYLLSLTPPTSPKTKRIKTQKRESTC